MSFIDKTGNTVWTEDQISRYCERLVLNEFPRRRVRELDDMVTGAAQGRYAPTAEEAAEIEAYGDLRFSVRERRLTAIADNELLAAAIAYEQAMLREVQLQLLINGRAAVPETPEEVDPDSGEVIQAFVPAVEAIEPLPATIEQDGEVVDNPAYLAATAELAQVTDLISGASQEVLDLVEARSLV